MVLIKERGLAIGGWLLVIPIATGTKFGLGNSLFMSVVHRKLNG